MKLFKYCIIYFFSISFLIANTLNLNNEPIQPITLPTHLNQEKVTLGKKLFFDTKLSQDNTISCATCHPIEQGGTDNLRKSFGVKQRIGLMNTPTVLNSGFNFVQFWDGRAKTLEEQIDGPIHNINELATNWKEIVNKLKQDNNYVTLFQKVFKEQINGKNIKNAIAEFERSLVTPSRFDRYLLGDMTAITTYEKEGYALFKSYGCISCHQGKNVGGNFYEKLGVFKPYPFKDIEENLGRYKLLKTKASKHEFKVPSLRNVGKTYPYLHNGSIQTLKQMILTMGEYQLGREIPLEDVRKIEAFLHALTWEKIE